MCVKQTIFLGYNFAAILYLQLMLLVMLFPKLNILYFYSFISTVCSLCTVPHVAVFCSSLMSRFPRILLRYCLNDLEMVPVTSIEIGITFVFTLLLLLLLLHLCTNYASFLQMPLASPLYFPALTKPKVNTSQYRVIHKSLRNFRTRLRNNEDIHGRKEHINR